MRWAEMDGAKQRVQGRWRYWSGPGCPGGLQEARLKIILSFVLFSSVGIQPVAGQDVAARTQSFDHQSPEAAFGISQESKFDQFAKSTDLICLFQILVYNIAIQLKVETPLFQLPGRIGVHQRSDN